MTKPLRRPRKGALLLETLVALSILIGALGVMSAQLIAGLRMTDFADEETRGTQLADRMLTLLEIDATTIANFFAAKTSSGDFGTAYPGWFWRATVEPVKDLEGLGMLRLQILRQEDSRKLGDMASARIIRDIGLLKADPGRINLGEDFGFNEEQMAQLAESVPIPEFDPTALDPQALASLDPQTMIELAPVLLPLLAQLSGGGLLPPDILGQLLGGAGGGLPPELIGQLLGGGGLDQDGLGQLLGGGGFSPEMIGQLLSSAGIQGISPELISQLTGALESGAITPDMIAQMMGGLGGGGLGGMLGGLPGGGISPGGAAGLGGGGVDPAVEEMLRSQLEGQVSEEELDALLGGLAANGARSPGAAGPGSGRAPMDVGGGRGGRGGGRGGDGARSPTPRSDGRTPSSISDLNRDRNTRNGGRGGRGGT